MTSGFTRLARKSCLVLQGLRSVSNSSSPSQISTKRINSLLINPGNPKLATYSPNCINGEYEFVFKDNQNLCSYPNQFFVCGPCHGLFCFHNSGFRSFALFNPATGYIKNFPWNHFLNRGPFDLSYRVHSLGFGFDSKVNELKIIRCIVCDDWIPGKEMHIEIISLNSMQRREMPALGEITSLIPSWSGVPSVDGVCYWSAYDKFELNTKIVSFEITDEVFDLFTLPPCDYPNYIPCSEDCLMETLYGLPAAIRYNINGNSDKFIEVWVKKKREAWLKEVCIGPISGVIKPLCFLNNDGLILLDSDYQLVLYDFVTKQVNKLNIQLSKPIERGYSRRPPTIQVLNLPKKSVPTIHGLMAMSKNDESDENGSYVINSS